MANKKFKDPNQFRAYIALAWYAFRAQTRNPATFAFGFIFPIVFISIFGLIGNSSLQLKIGIPTNQQPPSAIVNDLSQQNYISIDKEDIGALKQKLQQGNLSGILETTMQNNHVTLTLLASSANPQETSALAAVLGNLVDKTNLQIAGVRNPAITLQQSEISGRQIRYIDFALPGQIGFSLLSTAIFGTVFGLIYLKKALILKRMFATPTQALTILLSQGTSRLIMALLQTVLILGMGVLIFKFYLPFGILTFLELILLSAFGLIAFLGFGYFLAGIANDENAAGPLVNLVTLPQFLLSGTFFPTSSLPTWVQPVANNLPLSYFNIAIRKITTEGGNITDTVPYLIGLVIWGTVMYLLAARTFKWE